MNTQTDESKSFSREIRLQKAGVDFRSTKIQVVIATILSTVLLLFLYQPSMYSGFLLDDFLHLDYVSRALDKGDAHDFLANLYSNWGGSDLMKSYRPVVSISIFLDYLIWKTNAFGYHLLNTLLMAGCSIFVGLIASEVSGTFGNRMRATTAIWSSLLFAAYPLHVESVSWIIGRVDVLSTLFYLSSLYFFMRLRLVREPLFLMLSVASFILSLASKEIAVTLPVVATLYVVLIPNRQILKGRAASIQAKALLALWATLAGFAIVRSLLIGSAIGGYGSDFSIDSAITLFTYQGTWDRIFCPINGEMFSSVKAMKFAHVPILMALLFAAIRCVFTPSLLRILIFFATWMLIAILPAFQVWHIADNLAGARLFFLSSAPYCLFLTFALLPAEDVLPKKIIRFTTFAGTLLLAYNLVIWAIGCHINQVPFQKAGEGMQKMHAQLNQLVDALPRQSSGAVSNEQILLLNLPSDYRGAPMITRPGYLKTMLAKPFSARDISQNIITAEPDVPCDHRFLRHERLINSIFVNPVRHVYMWSDADEKIVPWSTPQGNVDFKIEMAKAAQLLYEPKTTRIEDATRWHVFNEKYPQIEKLPNQLRLYSGLRDPNGLVLRASIDPINPLAVPLVRIKMKIHADQPIKDLMPLLRFSFQQERHVVNIVKQAKLLQMSDSEFECPLFFNKEWLLGGSVKEVGIKIPPSPYYIDLESIEGVSGPKCVPRLTQSMSANNSAGNFLQVDVSKIPEAKSSILLISKAGTTFDTNVEELILMPYRIIKISLNRKSPESSTVDIPDEWLRSRILQSAVLSESISTFKLPANVYNDGEVHQVVALALDKNGKVLGLPSPMLKVQNKGGH
ncbi:MAG: hypothetical protein IAF58_11705 [Leptolyngbya sp.]|nr:hypothetical protein [Candidatus Melainabacteria bacterium]